MLQANNSFRAALLSAVAGALAGCNSSAIGLNALDAPVTYEAVIKIGIVVGVIAAVLGVAVYFVSAFGRWMSR